MPRSQPKTGLRFQTTRRPAQRLNPLMIVNPHEIGERRLRCHILGEQLEFDRAVLERIKYTRAPRFCGFLHFGDRMPIAASQGTADLDLEFIAGDVADIIKIPPADAIPDLHQRTFRSAPRFPSLHLDKKRVHRLNRFTEPSRVKPGHRFYRRTRGFP